MLLGALILSRYGRHSWHIHVKYQPSDSGQCGSWQDDMACRHVVSLRWALPSHPASITHPVIKLCVTPRHDQFMSLHYTSVSRPNIYTKTCREPMPQQDLQVLQDNWDVCKRYVMSWMYITVGVLIREHKARWHFGKFPCETRVWNKSKSSCYKTLENALRIQFQPYQHLMKPGVNSRCTWDLTL